MSRLPQNAALVVIDIQNGFDDPQWGPRNNPQAEENVARLLAAWRRSKRVVIHTQHMSKNPASPLYPGQPGNAIKDLVKPLPGEAVLQKSVNSAFIGTDLEQRLRQTQIETVVLAGITTAYCVSVSARMAGNLGFDTYVVSDGTATFDLKGLRGETYPADQVHGVGLAELQGEFATILATDELLKRL